MSLAAIFKDDDDKEKEAKEQLQYKREEIEIGDHIITVTAREMHVALQDAKIKKFKYAIDDLIDSL